MSAVGLALLALGAIASNSGIASGAPRSGIAAARSASDTLHDRTVTVGSFDFAESTLLAEIYSQAMEHAGIRVRRVFDLGPREVAAPALAVGLIEFLPEYTGTAVRFSSLGAIPASSDPEDARQQLATALADRDVSVMEPAPAQDANAFVVTSETAARYGLERLSDLAHVARDLVFGGPAECPSRPLCLQGLRRVYDVEFEDVVQLDAGGPLTKRALRSRAVDVGLLFTSDPSLQDGDFKVLEDDRSLQPAENIVPLVRNEIVGLWGATLVSAIDAVSRRLDTPTLRRLNGAVADGHRTAAVAEEWLRSEGLA